MTKTILRARAPKELPKTAYPVITPEGVKFTFKNTADWELEHIDKKTLLDLQEDPYAVAVFNKLCNLIFQDPYMLEIRDENDKVNDKLTKLFKNLFDAPGVELWQQMKTCFGAWYWAGPYVGSMGINYDGLYYPSALVDLPTLTFSSPGENASDSVAEGRILKGICIEEDGRTHYYQEQKDEVVQLFNCFHLKPPGYDYDVAGLPLIFPLLKTFKKMGFAWLAQMQCVTRAGAPSIFIRVKNGNNVSWKLAKDILKNYNKNNLYPLWEDMEPIEVHGNVPDISLKTIELLTKVIIYMFSTSDLVTKEGTLIGGSNSAEKELLKNFIKGFHTALINGFQPIIQKFLEYNGFLGYKAVITIPAPEFTDETLDLGRAAEGRAAQDIYPNEHRKFLGLPPKSEEELTKMKNWWSIPTAESQAYQQEQFKQTLIKAQVQQDESKKGTTTGKKDEKNDKNIMKNKIDIPTREEIQKLLEQDLEDNIRSFFAEIRKIRAAKA